MPVEEVGLGGGGFRTNSGDASKARWKPLPGPMQAVGVNPSRKSAGQASKLMLYGAASSEVSVASDALGAFRAAAGFLSLLKEAAASGAPGPGIVKVEHGRSAEVKLDVQKQQVLDVDDVRLKFGDQQVA